jgi:hypothetical protein
LPAYGPVTPLAVLYDQTNNAGSNVADSTEWGSHYNTLSSQAADDFVVPGNAIWRITTATAAGAYMGTEGSGVLSLLVQFYTDSGSGLPFSPVLRQTILGATISGLDSGIFVVTLASPLIVGPGHYWYSVQARLACTVTDCKK